METAFVLLGHESRYPLIREVAGTVPVGIAVQDGNYEDVDPQTGERITISDLFKFATENLNVNYLFWCTQEPYYSEQLIPFIKRLKA